MIPPFSDAVADFESFLAAQSRPTAIEWLGPGDFLLFRRTIYVRAPLSPASPESARELFERGRGEGLGVALEALEHDATTTYALVRLPHDYADAAGRFMSAESVKMSAPESPRRRVVRSGKLKWAFLRAASVFRRRQSFDD